MREGAFASMEHEHRFVVVDTGTTDMFDRFAFAAPLGALGIVAERLVLERYMRALLARRNEGLRAVAESDAWRAFLEPRTAASDA